MGGGKVQGEGEEGITRGKNNKAWLWPHQTLHNVKYGVMIINVLDTLLDTLAHASVPD